MTDSLFRRLVRVRILGASLLGATVLFFGGIFAWGAFNTFMEATNTLEFCITCHEMESTVAAEYKRTAHYQNRSGVRAICSDCHVPDPWVYKLARKIQATNELIHWARGTIDTPEKFESKRLTLAKHVWKAMKETDSRECRNCHTWDTMTDRKQRRRAWKQHQLAQDESQTCIDCHKGIAHRPVHKLLTDKDDPYDGKDDPRKLEVATIEEIAKEMGLVETAAEAAPATAMAAAAPAPAPSAAADSSGIDWTAAPATEVVLFYPGQASVEWVLTGSDHGGARAIKKINDRCAECHNGEQADMGKKMVTGEKAETMVIPGKRAAITMSVRAAHDGETLYMQFQWPDTGHTPVPFVDGGKMDPDNQTKLAVMFDDNKVEAADYMGCWVTCHHDSRYMPDHPKDTSAVNGRLDVSTGITKYLPETRTEIEISGDETTPRGGWDKLKEAAEIDAMKGEGAFMDLVRYMSGGAAEQGYILEQRSLAEASDVTFTGGLADGTWTALMTRPLKGTGPGSVAIEPGQLYTVGFAIHDDYTSARFHHVSLEYRLGIDHPEAEIKVAGK